MLRNKLFKSFFATLIVVGIVEISGITLHLFYTFSWFDMVMHFLGGFFIAFLSLLILTTYRSNRSYGQLLFCGILTAVVAGVVWEFYELYFGMTYFYSPDYWGDNGMDLTMDVTGGLVVVWYGYLKIKNFKL